MDTKETIKIPVEQKTVTGHKPLANETVNVTIEVEKKKRKYSRGTAGAQQLGRGLNKAALDLSSAVTAALQSYEKRSNQSSYEKRDGMMRDAVENMTRAAGKGIKVAADAPYDLVKALTRGKNGKQFRSGIKVFTPPMFR